MPCKKTRNANGFLLAAVNARTARCSAVEVPWATLDDALTHKASNKQPTL
jgi:hypothetical protein